MSYRYKVASIFLLGFFIDCINIFMSAVALPSLSATLQVSSASVAWVANAYILGLTLIIALSTWLAARFGSREILTASMLVFSGSVWLCGQADSFHELVIWRFVQGIGGGLLIPVGQALTFNLFHGEQRAKISTLIMAVALIAPAMSPTVGGLIVDISSWRWVFYSTLPFSLLAAGLSWWWVREGKTAELQRPDIKGLLLVSAVLASLLMGMSLYGGDYPPLAALGFVIAGLTFIALYLLHYRRCSNAIIDLSLLRSRKLSTSIFIYYAIPGVFTGVNLMSIFFLQNTLHFSARLTGMFMILYAIGAFIAMILCGRVYNRTGARRLFTLGMLLHSAGIATLVLVNAPTDLWLIMIAYSLMGIGGGIGANTAQTTSLMDFTGGDTHKASVIWNINRQMSFSLGAALFLMIFNVLLPPLGTTPAYQATFAIAALVGLLPLLQMNQLPCAKERP
ncbi:MFS transporter [Pseudomonas siliginis]|uniref:MFS transporter n=1 Tax=Pseudomonas siliginis TaxID=2842346 RepID=A0ABY5C9R9_9PSED|nr:MFS transporter [Pseudomonas siliginis]UST84001.1 MFS transporter [Pseudomonas siliginis]UST89193.1 MFS transporter [Pseudomonas siliginis]